MEILIGFILGVIVCRSNDKYGWFNKIIKKIKSKK
jgi:hypothetical protein